MPPITVKQVLSTPDPFVIKWFAAILAWRTDDQGELSPYWSVTWHLIDEAARGAYKGGCEANFYFNDGGFTFPPVLQTLDEIQNIYTRVSDEGTRLAVGAYLREQSGEPYFYIGVTRLTTNFYEPVSRKGESEVVCMCPRLAMQRWFAIQGWEDNETPSQFVARALDEVEYRSDVWDGLLAAVPPVNLSVSLYGAQWY
ncbi:hypothetical protein B9Z65_4866 [Elsinoe australis]|uniref:Uncharacterized protein n=1 Tax=Elsinoe australis TaxID=40998 RepID=A0A2P8A6A2_9PEZI|nr:hypothetical protein B9Z65_4866 [Elsinoe australis]